MNELQSKEWMELKKEWNESQSIEKEIICDI